MISGNFITIIYSIKIKTFCRVNIFRIKIEVKRSKFMKLLKLGELKFERFCQYIFLTKIGYLNNKYCSKTFNSNLFFN